MDWTYERTEMLRKLWNTGLPCKQIARELGGVSRNAVIGRARRIGLAMHKTKVKRPMPQRLKLFRMPAARSITNTPKPPILTPAESSTKLMPLVELTLATCRFPHGDEAPYLFCGSHTAEGFPYCGYHCGIAYQSAHRK